MKFGVTLGALHPGRHVEATELADRLGFESVWMPEHLVFPVEMTRSPYPGQDHPPVPPQTPVHDVFAYLSFLAGRTERIRLGSHVYNVGLRHPFVAARAVATLDLVSGGRAIFGVGASWLESEWQAVGLDFATRGPRVDECLEVCRRLWTEEVIEHRGRFFDFDPVMFEPKPVQRPGPPIIVGGVSRAALRRAARLGDGWIGMGDTEESVTAAVAELRRLREELGRADEPFEITCGAPITSEEDVERLAAIGVDRCLVAPWRRSREAIDGLHAFAGRYLGGSA